MPNPRKLLYPFSVLYHAVTGIRNEFYDRGILSSSSYDLPVICVGNLNVGGTGKSPMIEYLIGLLKDEYKLAVLSRGYKRNTKGFKLVEVNEPASSVGDEPLQFKNKFPEVTVAVDANRREGIAELLKYSPDIILLDDAFQHRKVNAGFNILLTAYTDLFADDLLLPAGNLRESRSGARRADVIVVTKCPLNLERQEMNRIKEKLHPKPGQHVFFTGIGYADEVRSRDSVIPLRDIPQDFTLVTGIANPVPLVQYLQGIGRRFRHLKYPDHHNFSEKELQELRRQKGILTTEKDYMRLRDSVGETPLYYLPIQTEFLRDKELFNAKLKDYINEK